ncbi:ATP-binding protein [Massilia sp. W12]|uniref:sensor histidine kinase n=1 Tax=Massilia sp. W12 TaxID=3126507 RepID=UPI0030D583E6
MKLLPAGLRPIEARESFWRSLQTFGLTRVVVASVLLVYTQFNAKGIEVAQQFQYPDTGVFYLLSAILLSLSAMYYRQHFTLQLLAQVTLDLVIIALLYIAAGGAKSGLAILFLLPLAGLAVLAPLMLALTYAAMVSLFLVLEGTYQVFLHMPEVPILQTGLYGVAFFTTVVVVSRLAGKLIRQEELALQRGRDLQMQLHINRIVIADVGDGILVLGDDSSIYSSNPAAQTMLGLHLDDIPDLGLTRLSDLPTMHAMVEAHRNWLQSLQQTGDASLPDTASQVFLSIRPLDEQSSYGGPLWSGRREQTVHLKVRFVRVHGAVGPDARTVLFLQDVGEIENQAQQLKLASMGRLTASIAHEVRNPLAAISHAAALLSEELNSKTQVRLLNIVGDNVTRVNRMIEDILQLSRKVQPNNEPLNLSRLLGEIRNEFEETHELPESLLMLGPPSQALVRFDPLHLREVVVNLLSNAVRYASGRPGSIKMLEVIRAGRLELHVQDDGPGISSEVRAHLFEPFYTTSSKGTGLGLYLARELCMNNGAMLDYEYRIDDGDMQLEDESSGRFVISFGAWEKEAKQ